MYTTITIIPSSEMYRGQTVLICKNNRFGGEIETTFIRIRVSYANPNGFQFSK